MVSHCWVARIRRGAVKMWIRQYWVQLVRLIRFCNWWKLLFLLVHCGCFGCYVDKRCPGLKEEVSTSQARRRTLRCRGKRQIFCLAKQRVRWWDPRGWTWLSIVTLSREVRQSINPTVHWLYSPHSLYQSCHVSSYHRWHSLSLISFNNLTYIHLFVHDKCMTGIDDLHNHHRSHSNTAHTKVTLGCISRRHLSPLYMPITML